ncbi:MAG: hypothetical protein LAQ30_24130 [Acidobacteriia bacterium]|nr:hypothetical protein [Terriglobia bacterium]
MATAAQIAANRLNAQRSTGPRSAEGKAASRFNALKHGIDARAFVIPGEDPAELEALAADYREQFRPVGPLENFLVETLVHSDWNRRRLTRAQAQLLSAFLTAEGAPSESPLAFVLAEDATGPNILDRLARQLAGCQRHYFRALAELRRAQRERQAEKQDAEPSAAGLAACASQPLAPPPARPAAAASLPGALFTAQIGFVPPDPASTRAACPTGDICRIIK